MLVSWNWLARYVDLTLDHDALVDRLSLSGLNHESSETVDGEIVIDLEVTSNRGDCLGHLGVAREIAVLTGQSLRVPTVKLSPSATPIAADLAVENRFVEACPRYTAHVIRGVKIGPSPAWLQTALTSIGLKPVNHVVDVTNYVMMECGQPLHAFDLAKVGGGKIIVRPAAAGETLNAIDHRNYALLPTDCVIADAKVPIAIAGVMGSADSEVDESTTDIVLEAAIFTPLTVRRTARRVKLHSPSSFRYERRVDSEGLLWAAQRACELILDSAGGSLAAGTHDEGDLSGYRPATDPVSLRTSRITQVLGIDVPAPEVTRILTGLGCDVRSSGSASHSASLTCGVPSWRHDLTREIDLIEEVARIHGYDKIPEQSSIPVAPSSKRPFDLATARLREVLTASGYSEAMTPSIVTDKLDEMLSPWTDRPPLKTRTAMLVGSKTLRRSLLPSLLSSRAANQASASLLADLFEIAHVYLPPESDNEATLPRERYHLGIVGGEDFFALKGVIETLLVRLGIDVSLTVEPIETAGLERGGAVGLQLGGDLVGYLGFVDSRLLKSLKLPGRVTVAELSLEPLMERCHLVPQQRPVSAYPSIRRDLNLIVPESVRWSELAKIIHDEAVDRLAGLTYQETYRNESVDGPEKKRVLFTIELQSLFETLSGSDADAIIDAVVGRCEADLAAILMR